MDDGIQTKEIVAPSAGVHIILPSYFSPRNMGLIDPKTSDGRVIFFLPWEGLIGHCWAIVGADAEDVRIELSWRPFSFWGDSTPSRLNF